MQIESILKRTGGTQVTLGGQLYDFQPLQDGAHVADVDNSAHIQRFLGIPEGYRIYGQAPAAAPVAPAPEPKRDVPVILLGSDVHEANYEIGGKTYALGDVVALAQKDSLLDAEAWNALDAEARHSFIDAALDKLAAGAVTENPPDERATLIAQYEAKFGQKPASNISIKKLREKLAAE